MKYRILRIAWSVFWALACVLFLVLWVRSYWYVDILNNKVWGNGVIGVAIYPSTMSCSLVRGPCELGNYSDTIDGYKAIVTPPGQSPSPTFHWITGFGSDGTNCLLTFRFPLWFPVLLFGTLTTAPFMWLSRQFSLRTLLITTTLIAILLGMVVWFR